MGNDTLVSTSEYAAHVAYVLHMRYHALDTDIETPASRARQAEVVHLMRALAAHLAQLDPAFNKSRFILNCGVAEVPPTEGNVVKLHTGETEIVSDEELKTVWEWHDKHAIKSLDDDCYPAVTVFDEGEQPTRQQMTALFRKWKQNDCGMSWRDFAKTAEPTFGCAGAITVAWCGMWICIERDGYCHS
jgi:hypothetical protein